MLTIMRWASHLVQVMLLTFVAVLPVEADALRIPRWYTVVGKVKGVEKRTCLKAHQASPDADQIKGFTPGSTVYDNFMESEEKNYPHLRWERIGPPTYTQNCVGYVMEKKWRMERFSFLADVFYKAVIEPFGYVVPFYEQYRKGDIAVWLVDGNAQHVAWVKSGTLRKSSVVIETKDEAESVWTNKVPIAGTYDATHPNPEVGVGSKLPSQVDDRLIHKYGSLDKADIYRIPNQVDLQFIPTTEADCGQCGGTGASPGLHKRSASRAGSGCPAPTSTMEPSKVHRTLTGSGVFMAPGYMKQAFSVHEIDARDLLGGGSINISISIGQGESSGSFDLFPENVPIPTTGRPTGTLVGSYDVPPGSDTRLSYKFSKGQVFRFGATGNWFSEAGKSNTYTFTAVLEGVATENQPPPRQVKAKQATPNQASAKSRQLDSVRKDVDTFLNKP